MSKYAMQKNAFAASGEHLAAGDRRHSVLCPKPRRMGILPTGGFSRQLRWESSPKQHPCGSKTGVDFVEFFLSKGADSPSMSLPFFCGSPPTRSSNPVVHDARFGEDRPVLPLPSPTLGLNVGGSPLSPRNSGGCARKLGVKPATVRIEGFDCLDRGRRRSCSITAVA